MLIKAELFYIKQVGVPKYRSQQVINKTRNKTLKTSETTDIWLIAKHTVCMACREARESHQREMDGSELMIKVWHRLDKGVPMFVGGRLE